MSYQIQVALTVINDALYQDYRAAMLPILERHGGRFVSDFKVSDTLLPTVNSGINRTFSINFPDQSRKVSFFENADYLAVKAEFFVPSVQEGSVVQLAAFEVIDE